MYKDINLVRISKFNGQDILDGIKKNVVPAYQQGFTELFRFETEYDLYVLMGRREMPELLYGKSK